MTWLKGPRATRPALRIVEWNVKTGNPTAHDTIARLVAEHDPDVLVLIEVAYLHAELVTLAKTLGMDLFQEAPLSWRPGRVVPEHGDTAVLVRKGFVTRSHIAPMRVPWIGPVNDWAHAPRRYWRLRLKVRGRRWRLSVDHWPTGGTKGRNGKAVTETLTKARRWLRRGLGVVASVIVGDLNIDTRVLIALLPGAQVVGSGPDNAVVRGCSATRTVLEKYGSDHKAVVVDVT